MREELGRIDVVNRTAGSPEPSQRFAQVTDDVLRSSDGNMALIAVPAKKNDGHGRRHCMRIARVASGWWLVTGN